MTSTLEEGEGEAREWGDGELMEIKPVWDELSF